MGKDKKHKKGDSEKITKMPRELFEKELRKLQTELCYLQDHIKKEQLKIIVVFEGRDAAGKGGVIQRITERVSPRVFRVEALPAPGDREKTQWYPQRYIERFPAGGELVLFDRSWYNRSGVEHVMGFCSQEEYARFLKGCPAFEEWITGSGIQLIKYFFDVGQEEQEKRVRARIKDPMRHWKLSPMDIESWQRWWDYTAAYERMLEATDTSHAPWYRVQADDKRRARLNCISHLLSQFSYAHVDWEPPELGKRQKKKPGTPDKLTFRHEVPLVY